VDEVCKLLPPAASHNHHVSSVVTAQPMVSVSALNVTEPRFESDVSEPERAHAEAKTDDAGADVESHSVQVTLSPAAVSVFFLLFFLFLFFFPCLHCQLIFVCAGHSDKCARRFSQLAAPPQLTPINTPRQTDGDRFSSTSVEKSYPSEAAYRVTRTNAHTTLPQPPCNSSNTNGSKLTEIEMAECPLSLDKVLSDLNASGVCYSRSALKRSLPHGTTRYSANDEINRRLAESGGLYAVRREDSNAKFNNGPLIGVDQHRVMMGPSRVPVEVPGGDVAFDGSILERKLRHVDV
jgi:hypothetical protein